MVEIDKITRRLGISDGLQDLLISDLINDTEAHFKLLTGTETIDDKYSFIVEAVVVKRYNRKGSEGMKSETVDGYSVTYNDGAGDFDEFLPLLNKAFDLDGSATKGVIRFI